MRKKEEKKKKREEKGRRGVLGGLGNDCRYFSAVSEAHCAISASPEVR